MQLKFTPTGDTFTVSSFLEVEGAISFIRKRIRDIPMSDMDKAVLLDTIRKVRLVLKRIGKNNALGRVDTVEITDKSAVILVTGGGVPGTVLEPATFYYKTNVVVTHAGRTFFIYLGVDGE